MRRIKLPFAPGLDIEFTDRGRALDKVKELAEKGTRYPVVVFGPEGCGKTSWLLQSVEILKEEGYGVIYFNPMRKSFLAEIGIRSIEEKVREVLKRVSSTHEVLEVVWRVIDLVKEAIRLGKRRVAAIVDDAFQLIGDRNAALFVKGLLEIIEHPVEEYERITAIAATSEGFSRREIGRHRWAWLRPMWNMGRKGFEELYEKLPNPKPPFEDVWLLTGGNPDTLAKLYQADWSTERVVADLTKSKEVSRSFVARWRKWLEEAVRDPDILWDPSTPEGLVNELIARNLIVYNMYNRDPWFWIDEPPPERDPELGISRYVAWQTPLHREAVRRALEEL